jgi:predicted membrane channel-forming protein YqfA (hemolysin III family)
MFKNKIGISLFIVTVTIVFGVFIYAIGSVIYDSRQPPITTQVPDNPAYKQEMMFNRFESWAVYDTRGYRYEISKADFDSLTIPQKIGDGLYKLPNGDYVSGIIK